MILQIVLIVILERSELIHLILYLLNMLTSPNVIILIGSVVNKNKKISTTTTYLWKRVCIKINECLYIINAIL